MVLRISDLSRASLLVLLVSCARSSTSTAAPLAPPSAAAASAPRSTSGDDFDEEMTLLKAANGSVATDPARALDLCSEFAKRFPDSAFTQERDIIIIRALVGLGRLDEAREHARAFKASYPDTPYVPVVPSDPR